MGKKTSRKMYSSKGERASIDRSTVKAVRREQNTFLTQLSNKFDAFLKGKKVMVTIENPIKTETNKPFVKVEGRVLWGDWREARRAPILRGGND